MNIFRRELKDNFKSLLIWALGIIFMIAGGMSKYSAASKSGQSMNDLLSKMPPYIQSLFGIGSFDLSLATGFYGVLFLYLVIMAVIHASLLGATIISKEERDKTSEFLYSKPITRRFIITKKVGAGLVLIILLNSVTLFSSLAIVSMFSKGENVAAFIIPLMMGLLILQLLFYSLGLGTSALQPNPKSGSSLVSGLLLFFFFLYKLIDMTPKLDLLKYLTPFAYFDAQRIMTSGINPVYVVLSFVIIITMVYTSYVFYGKRDLVI
jgi:ABC-2 type transport system permease protein